MRTGETIMTLSIQTSNDLIYTGRIDNDNIDDTVTRTCESIVELDHIPAWFPFAGAPYYEEVGVDCRYDVYLSTCETPAKKIAVYNPVVVDFDPMGFRVYDPQYIDRVIPGNSGVTSVSVGPQPLNCGRSFYDSCRLYVDDDHLELTCLEKGLKNNVLEIPF